MIVLGIETSCDETACSVVKDGREILSNIVASQIELHSRYGGVVPELACRRHIDLMMPVIDQSLKESSHTLSSIDLIAVTNGPGLIGALLIGLNTAKTLSLAINKPFIAVNHVEAHLYAVMMSQEKPVEFPCLGVVVSGGHTHLIHCKSLGCYELIGQTVDDAIGEAFDKAAKLLGLPYPGGPEIERLAKNGDPFRFPFKGGQIKGKPFDFSFSGLKTAVLYTLLKLHTGAEIDSLPAKERLSVVLAKLSDQDKCDLAASFQRAALEDVVKKTILAAKKYDLKTVILGGGVTNSQKLRELFETEAKNNHLRILWPSAGLSLDNAAMIAGLGYHLYCKNGKGDSIDLDPLTRIPFATK